MTDSAADIHYTLILIFALNVRSYVEAYRVSKAVNRSRFVSVSQRTSRDPGHEWFSLPFGVRALSAARLTGAGNLTPVAAEGELLQKIGYGLAHGEEFNFNAAFGRNTGDPSRHAQRLG